MTHEWDGNAVFIGGNVKVEWRSVGGGVLSRLEIPTKMN